MKILAIDTSGPIAFVSLSLDSGETLSEKTEGANSHNEGLGRLVELVLGKAKVSPSQLDRIVLGCGPGSFTGLRIGYGFAQGLALSNGIPVEPVSSLAGYAYSLASSSFGGSSIELIAAVSDARRDELFFGLYKRVDEGKFALIGSEEIVAASTIQPRVAKICGDHAIRSDRVGIVGFAAVSGIIEPKQVAEGLTAVSRQIGAKLAYSAGLISSFAPNYLRDVSARTIAQRRQLDGN